MRTIYTGTLKDMAGLAGWSQAITFDLNEISTVCCEVFRDTSTFLFRHDLQFMLSRGSLFDIRLFTVAGRRSIPT